ncbi:MAG: hypothetical protein ABIE94_06255 [archaeon]
MTCYVIPAAAAIIHLFMRKKIPSWMDSEKHKWLNLLLAGGAMFGAVDHLWNGELMFFAGDWLGDLTLGITITTIIIAAWAIASYKSKVVVEDKTSA